MIARKGGEVITEESQAIIKKQGKVATGTCAVTKAGKLPCSWIIHAVGPIWDKHAETEARRLLKACVTNVYEKAVEMQLGSLSISAISSGIFGYPKDLCATDMLQELELAIGRKQGSLDYIRFCSRADSIFSML